MARQTRGSEVRGLVKRKELVEADFGDSYLLESTLSLVLVDLERKFHWMLI